MLAKGEVTNPDDDSDFDVSRADLFEALGHQTRIKILQVLNDRPMTFSELKRGAGISSSGLLSFHLSKLAHLVSGTPDGAIDLMGRLLIKVI